MDEGQTEVIRVDDDLAYPGADRSAALLVKVNQAVPAGDLGCRWSNRRNDIPEFPDNVTQPGLKVFEVLLYGMC